MGTLLSLHIKATKVTTIRPSTQAGRVVLITGTLRAPPSVLLGRNDGAHALCPACRLQPLLGKQAFRFWFEKI